MGENLGRGFGRVMNSSAASAKKATAEYLMIGMMIGFETEIK